MWSPPKGTGPHEGAPLLSVADSNGTASHEPSESTKNEDEESTPKKSFFGERAVPLCGQFSCETFFKSSSPARFTNPRVYCFLVLMLLPYSLLLAATSTTQWHRLPDSSPSMHCGLLLNCTGDVCAGFDSAIWQYQLGAFLLIFALLSVFLVPLKSFSLPRWRWESFLTVWILLWFVISMTGSLLAAVTTPYGTSGAPGNSCFMAVTASGLSLLVWMVKMYVSCDSD